MYECEKFCSIVTVCFNAEHVLEKTIQSVLMQNSSDFEYLIIDGKSTDGTLKIIKNYKQEFKNKNIKYTYISEADTGIYNAMNKAIALVQGKYVIYLNAGDSLYSDIVIDSLKRVIMDITIDKYPQVIYGNFYNKYKHHLYYSEAKDINFIKRGLPSCHQAFLVERTVLREFGFDEKYKMAADYDLILRIYNAGYQIQKTNIVVCVYLIGGYSTSNPVYLFKEFEEIKISNGIKKYRSLNILKLIYAYLKNYLFKLNTYNKLILKKQSKTVSRNFRLSRSIGNEQKED